MHPVSDVELKPEQDYLKVLNEIDSPSAVFG